MGVKQVGGGVGGGNGVGGCCIECGVRGNRWVGLGVGVGVLSEWEWGGGTGKSILGEGMERGLVRLLVLVLVL